MTHSQQIFYRNKNPPVAKFYTVQLRNWRILASVQCTVYLAALHDDLVNGLAASLPCRPPWQSRQWACPACRYRRRWPTGGQTPGAAHPARTAGTGTETFLHRASGYTVQQLTPSPYSGYRYGDFPAQSIRVYGTAAHTQPVQRVQVRRLSCTEHQGIRYSSSHPNKRRL